VLVYRGGDKTDDTNKNANGVSTSWYHVYLQNGKSITTTHDNLQNASYKGRKITKMVQTVKNIGNSTADDVSLWVAGDPTMGIWYSGGVDKDKGATRIVTDERTYYYEDGSKVVFDADNAYISVGSLNAGFNNKDGNSNHIEKSKVADGTLIPINGGTIKAQSDGFDYADINSWYNKDGSVFQSPFGNGDDSLPEHFWDAGDSDNRWYGTAVYKLKAGTSTISLTAQTNSEGGDGNGTTWWTSSTTMPFKTQPVLNTPEPQAVTVDYQLKDLLVLPNVKKDVVSGDGTAKTTADKQVFMKGENLTYKLSASALPANRIDDMKKMVYQDKLPDGFDYQSANAADSTGKDVSDQFDFDVKDGTFTATAKASLLSSANQDKAKDFEVPTIELHGIANKDDVTLKNTYGLFLNDGEYDSNPVENPVKDIKVKKDVQRGETTGLDGQSIDKQTIAKGQVVTYPLSGDDLPANRATDVKSLVWQDKLPDTISYQSFKVFDGTTGEDITKNFKNEGQGNDVKIVADDTILKTLNQDKTKVAKLPVVKLYAQANQAGVTIDNTAQLLINDKPRETNKVHNDTLKPEVKNLPHTGSDNLLSQLIRSVSGLFK
jgi:fimbrial isopeptide formation D2 family protein